MMVSFYFYVILPSSIFLAVPIVSASGLSLISILELIFYFVNFFRSHFLFLFQYSLYFFCNRASTRFAPIFFLMSKFFVLIISPRKKGLRYSGTILHTKKKFSLSFAGFFVSYSDSIVGVGENNWILPSIVASLHMRSPNFSHVRWMVNHQSNDEWILFRIHWNESWMKIQIIQRLGGVILLPLRDYHWLKFTFFLFYE